MPKPRHMGPRHLKYQAGMSATRKAWLREATKGMPFDIPVNLYHSFTGFQDSLRYWMARSGTLTLMRSRITLRDGQTKTMKQLLAEESPPYASEMEKPDEEIAKKFKRGFWVDFILRKTEELYNRRGK